jgi:hypothetical protein
MALLRESKRSLRQPTRAGIVHTRPWADIVAFYRDRVQQHGSQIEPQLAFVERLVASPLSQHLHGATSMNGLLLSDRPDSVWCEHMLRVCYDPASDEFEFFYSRYAASDDTMTKCVPRAEGWDTFTRFLRYKYGLHFPDSTGSA